MGDGAVEMPVCACPVTSADTAQTSENAAVAKLKMFATEVQARGGRLWLEVKEQRRRKTISNRDKYFCLYYISGIIAVIVAFCLFIAIILYGYFL